MTSLPRSVFNFTPMHDAGPSPRSYNLRLRSREGHAAPAKEGGGGPLFDIIIISKNCGRRSHFVGHDHFGTASSQRVCRQGAPCRQRVCDACDWPGLDRDFSPARLYRFDPRDGSLVRPGSLCRRSSSPSSSPSASSWASSCFSRTRALSVFVRKLRRHRTSAWLLVGQSFQFQEESLAPPGDAGKWSTQGQ